MRSIGPRIILQLRINHKLVSRMQRLRAKGLLSAKEIGKLTGTKPLLVDYWRQQGLLKGVRLNDKNEYLYERPNRDAVQQIKRRTRCKSAN
jgi:hypothetical protein